jgi:hypothetical protein
MVAAADRLIAALAEVLQVAQREGLEPPRLTIGDLTRWALRQRGTGTCRNCYDPFPAPPDGPQLCPQCAIFLEPATSPEGGAA